MYSRHYCHFINMLQAYRNFFEWFTLSFDLNIYFREVFIWVIARGCGDPINQRDWTSYTSVFLTLKRRLPPQWGPHINKYDLYAHTPWGQTTMAAVLLSASRWPILCLFPQWTVLSGFSMNFPFFSSLSDVQLLLSTPSYSKQFIATYWQLRPLWWTSICRLQRGLHPESG